MALHKPDVSLGKESRKINLSGFPLFPQTWVPDQTFLRALPALGSLVPLRSTEVIHTSPPNLPTEQQVSISNTSQCLSEESRAPFSYRRTTTLQEPLPCEITSNPNNLNKQKAVEKPGKGNKENSEQEQCQQWAPWVGEKERPAKHWWCCLAPGRGGGSALPPPRVPHTHGGCVPAGQGQPASHSCCRIHSQPIIKPQPLIEPPKLNHNFHPDPAPSPNPGWQHSRAGHQGGVRKEPRDSRNLQFLHEQLQSLTASATSIAG